MHVGCVFNERIQLWTHCLVRCGLNLVLKIDGPVISLCCGLRFRHQKRLFWKALHPLHLRCTCSPCSYVWTQSEHILRPCWPNVFRALAMSTHHLWRLDRFSGQDLRSDSVGRTGFPKRNDRNIVSWCKLWFLGKPLFSRGWPVSWLNQITTGHQQSQRKLAVLEHSTARQSWSQNQINQCGVPGGNWR